MAETTAQKWLDKIHHARKEEKDWRDRAKKVVQKYRDEESQGSRFNILWPNTEIMRPSLFVSTPIPDVRRRFRDPDPVAKEVASVIERALSFSMDDYDFEHEIDQSVLDYVLPGRAVTRVRYQGYDEDGNTLKDDSKDKAYERVICETVDWDKFIRGPGKKWRDVKWIAFEHHFSKEELDEHYPGHDIQLDVCLTDKGTEEKDENQKRGKVYEIWDKLKREVIHVAPSQADRVQKTEKDPLELQRFFPVPRPIYAIETTDSLVPVEEYRLYEKQANEVNELSKRIQKIIDGCRVRGIYNATIKEFSQLLDAGDNELIPAESAQALLATGQGLDKAIAWFPVEQLAAVLSILYEQRELAKQTIYEITGLSDILRGASNPNETLGAQQLKAQTGSTRLQRRQREVQRYIRDILRLKAEIICEHFDPATLQVMVGKEIAPEVLQVMRDDHLRSYRVDIETDSTIISDQGREKEQIVELLTGISAFIEGMGPAVQSGYISAEASKSMLKAAIRRYKFGSEVEDALAADEVPEGQEAQLSPEEMQQQQMLQEQQQAEEQQAFEQAVQQAVQQSSETGKLQIAQQELQFKQAELQSKAQIEQAKIAADAQLQEAKLRLEAEVRTAELNLKAQELALKERELALKEAQTVKGFQDSDRDRETAVQTTTEATDRQDSVQMMLQQVTEAINALTGYVTAPKSVVYEQGRPVGISAGGQVRPIERDPSGNITGLQ